MFWVSVCILLGIPFKDTLNKRQLNSIGAWGSNMVSYDNFSQSFKLIAEMREIAVLI